MTTPFPFVASSVLEASQLNAITTLPIATKTANYVAVVGDVGKRIVMNMAGANTITINNSIFAEGDTIFLANKGAGSTTVTAGAGVTINTSGSLVLAQYGGGTLVALSASVFNFFSQSGLTLPSSVNYLCIAGGAGGGNGIGGSQNGGGGGAGGYRNSVSGEDSGGGSAAETPFTPTSGVLYTITVGAGGAANTNGTDSSIAGTGLTTITSVGGGRGGGNSTQAIGGSGGGGFTSSATGAAGTANQGFAGGNYASSVGGAGGGSDAVGANAPTPIGGSGNASSISGSSVTRAGGGAGGGNAFAGGAGGGGAGVQNGTAGSGTVNTGSGGGASGGGSGGGSGGSGGKGIVILRTPDTVSFATFLSGATTVQSGGFFVYTFSDSGSIKWGQ